MNDVTQFLFQPEGSLVKHKVRWVDVDGKPAAIAKDLASAAGYKDTDKAIRTHCRNAVTYPAEMAGQVRHVKVVFEPDIYRLLAQSNLPAGRQLEAMIFETILPSIRKHGGYIAGQETKTREQILADAVLLGQAVALVG